MLSPELGRPLWSRHAFRPAEMRSGRRPRQRRSRRSAERVSDRTPAPWYTSGRSGRAASRATVGRGERSAESTPCLPNMLDGLFQHPASGRAPMLTGTILTTVLLLTPLVWSMQNENTALVKSLALGIGAAALLAAG